jgi:hypothetical protein
MNALKNNFTKNQISDITDIYVKDIVVNPSPSNSWKSQEIKKLYFISDVISDEDIGKIIESAGEIVHFQPNDGSLKLD